MDEKKRGEKGCQFEETATYPLIIRPLPSVMRYKREEGREKGKGKKGRKGRGGGEKRGREGQVS